MNLTAALCLVLASLVPTEDPKKPAPPEQKPATAEMSAADRALWSVQRFSYPFETCVISGQKLGETPTEFVVNGKLVRTCCGDCQAKIVKDPAPTIAKIDAAVIAAQKAGYPLDTCVVTSEKLGATAVDKVVGMKLVRVANAEAATKLEAEPKTALKKLDEAYVKAQMPTYSLKTCPVSDEQLGTPEMGEPVNAIYGTQLVRFCCSGCIKTFEKRPEKYLAKITDARKVAR